jgi:hypothetical protein
MSFQLRPVILAIPVTLITENKRNLKKEKRTKECVVCCLMSEKSLINFVGLSGKNEYCNRKMGVKEKRKVITAVKDKYLTFALNSHCSLPLRPCPVPKNVNEGLEAKSV